MAPFWCYEKNPELVTYKASYYSKRINSIYPTSCLKYYFHFVIIDNKLDSHVLPNQPLTPASSAYQSVSLAYLGNECHLM